MSINWLKGTTLLKNVSSYSQARSIVLSFLLVRGNDQGHCGPNAFKSIPPKKITYESTNVCWWEFAGISWHLWMKLKCPCLYRDRHHRFESQEKSEREYAWKIALKIPRFSVRRHNFNLILTSAVQQCPEHQEGNPITTSKLNYCAWATCCLTSGCQNNLSIPAQSLGSQPKG